MNKLILSLSVFFLSLLLVSCSGQEGTTERIGKEIDKSIDSGKRLLMKLLTKYLIKLMKLKAHLRDLPNRQAERLTKRLRMPQKKLKKLAIHWKKKLIVLTAVNKQRSAPNQR